MKRFVLFTLALTVQVSYAADYLIVVSQKTSEDDKWAKVISALKKKHSAEVTYYKKSVAESLPALR